MEDELVLSIEGKNLGNLRVVDLKQQLEKRGLSKSGSKKDLVKRLKSQLEFEKLGEERKLGAGGDLKLELDAATEQNEFVQQYLARQQKLLAEQNTTNLTSESEEIQNSDEDEKYDSRDGSESNEIISEVHVNKAGDSEIIDSSKNQEITNLKESIDNIECKTDKTENQTEKLDTDILIMPTSRDLSAANTCNQSKTPVEQEDCSAVPYSLSDIQLPESPKKESTMSVVEKECTKPIALKKSTKSITEDDSTKYITERKSIKSVTEKNPTASVVEAEPAKPVAEKVPIKSVSEKDSINDVDDAQKEKEHETSSKTDKVKTNGLQISDNSVDSRSTSSHSKSQDSAVSPKSDDSIQNIKSSSNDEIYNAKQLKGTSKSRNDSADEKDSGNEGNKSKILKHRSSKISSRKLASPENVSKEIAKDRKKKISEDSRNQSSSDSGECKSDEEPKTTKASTPTRDVKRRYSRSDSSSESSNSESSESSPKQFSKISTKKPKVENVEKTDANETKCQIETVEKTIIGEESSKDASNCPLRPKLKIKRDNIVFEEQTSSKQESSNERNVLKAETRSDASMDKNELSDFQSSQTKEAENVEEIPKPYVSRKVTLSNRKLSRSSVEEKEESAQKKSKWGSFATSQKNSQNINISTSSLKSWFPEFKLINEPAPANEIIPMEQSPTLSDEKFSNQIPGKEGGMLQRTALTRNPNEQDNQLAMEEETIEQRPVSKIVFIQNLVRPFTLLQLKDLLKQHGDFIEEEFWIDKIKSKCIIVYETEEAAVKAKNALNNTRWPPSNPKILTVQYISEEEVEFHKRGGEPTKPTPEPPVEMVESYDVKPIAPVEESKRKDRENRREREKSKPLREWDKDKIVQDSPERERYMNKENEKVKSVEKKEKKESKRRQNDDTPAKLLDDLFQKTKSSPCIYWLPLTEEQIKERAEERRMKRLEQEKRVLKEQEGDDRKKIVRSGHRSRDRELPRSSSRSRSPVARRR